LDSLIGGRGHIKELQKEKGEELAISVDSRAHKREWAFGAPSPSCTIREIQGIPGVKDAWNKGDSKGKIKRQVFESGKGRMKADKESMRQVDGTPYVPPAGSFVKEGSGKKGSSEFK